jgi:hypothetical protein
MQTIEVQPTPIKMKKFVIREAESLKVTLRAAYCSWCC